MHHISNTCTNCLWWIPRLRVSRSWSRKSCRTNCSCPTGIGDRTLGPNRDKLHRKWLRQNLLGHEICIDWAFQQISALMKLLRQANVVDLISHLLFITITVYTTPEETIHYAKRRNEYENQPYIAFAMVKDQKSVWNSTLHRIRYSQRPKECRRSTNLKPKRSRTSVPQQFLIQKLSHYCYYLCSCFESAHKTFQFGSRVLNT